MMSNEKIIKVLGDGSFLRFNNWLAADDGHLNPVFIGEFKHPKAGNIEAFCKLYNPETKGLINEIVGYLMTRAVSVQQPDIAFIARLSTSYLPNLSTIAKREANAWLKSKPPEVACFCTSRLDGHSAAIHILRQPDDYLQLPLLQELSNDISGWPQYPQAIALDENIAHADRHYNNLLKLGKRSYALIDNGRLVNSNDENWQIRDLDANNLYQNKIFEYIMENRNTEKPSKSDIQDNAICCSESHEDKIREITNELDYWINLLLNKEESKIFSQFLTSRTKEISCLLKKRFHLLV